ncbi:conserved hypothetical protein, partial [Ricinus communis]
MHGHAGNGQVLHQRLLGFHGTHETHGAADDGGRPGAGRILQHVEQVEQGRRRIADGHHGAGQVRAPQLQRGGAARVAHVTGQRGHALVRQ